MFDETLDNELIGLGGNNKTTRLSIKKLNKDRGPCVICGKWTPHREPLKHEKWNNEWRESFICLACFVSVGPG